MFPAAKFANLSNNLSNRAVRVSTSSCYNMFHFVYTHLFFHPISPSSIPSLGILAPTRSVGAYPLETIRENSTKQGGSIEVKSAKKGVYG